MASCRRSAARSSRGERGSAAVEFVLVATLLVLLLLAVLEVAVYFYARNVVAASAADAARFAASEDVPIALGARRAQQFIAEGLDGADARAITCRSSVEIDAESGLAVSVVRCRGRIRVLFSPLPLPLVIDVRSSVLREGRR